MFAYFIDVIVFLKHIDNINTLSYQEGIMRLLGRKTRISSKGAFNIWVGLMNGPVCRKVTSLY